MMSGTLALSTTTFRSTMASTSQTRTNSTISRHRPGPASLLRLHLPLTRRLLGAPLTLKLDRVRKTCARCRTKVLLLSVPRRARVCPSSSSKEKPRSSRMQGTSFPVPLSTTRSSRLSHPSTGLPSSMTGYRVRGQRWWRYSSTVYL